MITDDYHLPQKSRALGAGPSPSPAELILTLPIPKSVSQGVESRVHIPCWG